MENAVNSGKLFKQDNPEPSHLGNRVEGVTTRFEPKAEAMAVMNHSAMSNLAEKRRAPFVGDEIVWTCYNLVSREMHELGRNDLATFREFDCNVARTTVGNEVVEMVGGFPVAVKSGVRDDVVNVQPLAELGFGQSATLADVVITLPGEGGLLSPVGATVPLDVALESPMVGFAPDGSRSPNSAMKGTVLAVGFGPFVSESLATVGTNLLDGTDVARVVLSGIDTTTMLQETRSATGLGVEGSRLESDPADSTSINMGILSRLLTFGRKVAGAGTKLVVSFRKFLATHDALFHMHIILQSDGFVKSQKTLRV